MIIGSYNLNFQMKKASLISLQVERWFGMKNCNKRFLKDGKLKICLIIH